MGELDLTLVCHYGVKPEPLAELLRRLVELLQRRCGRAFEPYLLSQMHATLIGLELDVVDGAQVNRWFWQHRRERHTPDPERLAKLVETTPYLPFSARFGGFPPDASYPFTSRGQHPYQRMFQLQGDQAVLMGWPEHAGTFPRTLAKLRRAFESAHVLHKYHADPERDDDNDLFLVLGHLDRARVPTTEADAVELAAREFLANHPTRVDIDRDAITLVRYSDPRLPEGLVQCWRPTSEVLRTVLSSSRRP